MTNMVKGGKININNLGEDNMLKQKMRLTKSEKEVMDTFWENEEGLTCTELVEASTEKSWKKTSAHLLIRSLLAKGFLDVSGFKKTTKNYARIFKAKMSFEDYMIEVIMANSTAEDRKQLIFKLIDEATLEELEDMKKTIDKYRLQLLYRKS